jgi:hypothetical protein
MKKSIIKIFNLILLSFLFVDITSAASEKIAAIVNDQLVTSYDVENTKKMFMILGNISQSDQETENKLYSKAREALINQILIEQKAKELGIKLDKSDIIEHISEIERQNNLTSGFFKSLMANYNIDYKYFNDRMKFDILLRRLQQALFPREYVNVDDINQVLIDSGSKPTKFSLRIFTSNDLSDESYRRMTKFAKSLGDCQAKYRLDYSQFANMRDVKEDVKDLCPLVSATAKSLKANENSGVLKTKDAFQIVMVCHREVEDTSEKENNIIAHSISEHKMSLQMQRFFSNLKKSAYIKIIDY